MTRKSYDTLQSDLSEARQYINVLIHDCTYNVINAHAYPHEYERVKTASRFMAMIKINETHNPNHVKRAIHTRHPGVVLIALPIPRHFVTLLAHDPESYCLRVKSTMKKYRQGCTIAWVPSGGNPALDFLTCRELILLAQPEEVIQ